MRCVVILCLILLAAVGQANDSLRWSELPELPDSHGLGGPLIGTHQGVLIVAGGANFPSGPPWGEDGQEPGEKVWHDRIYALQPGGDRWVEAGELPTPLAYAPTISTADGIYILGGETFRETSYATDQVLRLRWDAAQEQVFVDQRALPPLPKPSRYHAAAQIDATIFVTASHKADAESRTLDAKSLWSLDLAQPPGQRRWVQRPAWPGPPREKMAVAVQNAGAHDRYASPRCLYMFSGSNWVEDAAGEISPRQLEYFADAYRFFPTEDRWQRVAELPAIPETRRPTAEGYYYDQQQRMWQRDASDSVARQTDDPPALELAFESARRAAAAATVIPVGQSHILLCSGDSGRFVTAELPHRPEFPADVLAYHTITDRWTLAGEMPRGVVTTGAVRWQDRWVVPSGEVRPGVRTPSVQTLTVEPRKAEFGTVNLIVVASYLMVLVGMGIYFSRRKGTSQEFFLGGQRIPWWAAGISIYATQLSAITFVTLPAVPYVTNWMVYPGQLTIFLFAPVVIYFFLPFYRRLNVTTAYEYLEHRFHLGVRLLGSLIFVVVQFARMAIVVYIPALALTTVTGLDIHVCIIVMGVLATVYTVLGGIEAVIWTDVLQVVVLWGGMLLAIGIIVLDSGGLASVFATAQEASKFTMVNWSWETTQMTTWLIVLGNFALQFGPYTTDQSVVQRYMTTRDQQAAARSIWVNGILVIPFSFLFFVLGTCLFVFFHNHPEQLELGMQSDNVFPLFMAEQLPVGLSGLVIAGVFAASMSSLDSSMHSVATVLTTDFYRRLGKARADQQYYRFARGCTLLVGFTGTGVALLLASLDIQSLFFFFQKLLGLLGSGLVGIFLLGIFTRRANAVGVTLGAIASAVVLFYLNFYTQVNFYFFAVVGILTSVTVGYLASLLTGRSGVRLEGLTWYTRGAGNA